jgi:hypothetical protein
MKLFTLKNGIALALLGVAGILSNSCSVKCPDCKPTLNCATGDCGKQTDEPVPTTAPVSLVSETNCSDTANNCNGGAAPAPYECMVFAGCDTSQNPDKCFVKQASNTSCTKGSAHNCIIKPSGARGVAYCVTSGSGMCNWPDNTGCLPCGEDQQACCVGGCVPGKVCKDANGTVDLLNKQGSKCKT